MMMASNLVPLLLFASSAAAWTRTDHWQTKVITTTSSKLFTSSIPVYPTGGAPSPISSNTSTTLLTVGAAGAFIVSTHTYLVTITDLFYAADATGLCVSTGFKECSPTPTFTHSGSITTNYWHPIVVANPTSCTLTSYAYTTAQTVFPPTLFRSIPGAADQATESAQALLVTTYVSTKSTNLGGQAVTTTVCDVFLRQGAVAGVSPGYELSAMSQCVDPRVFSCSVITSQTPTAVCETAGQTYPPTAFPTGPGRAGQGTGAGGAPSPSKTGVASGLTSSVWLSFIFTFLAMLGLWY
jgi:hypothetical protein